MNTFATIEVAYRYRKVIFYTVRLEDDDENLALQFAKKHNDGATKESLRILFQWLRNIGEKRGAKERYFRNEGFAGKDARALPPPFIQDTDLRWYCMRVNDHIVFLFSGAVKTKQKAQDCINVWPHLRLAGSLCKAIHQALTETHDLQFNEEETELIIPTEFNLEL